MRWGVLIVSLFLFSSTGWGYERTVTENGIPVVWNQMPITYFIGKEGSDGIKDGSDIQAIKDAFAVWSNVDCARVTFVFGGLVESPSFGYDPNGSSNQNQIYWIQSASKWPYSDSVLASTELTYHPISGEILDADIIFNEVAQTWSTQGTPAAGSHDILNTAVHEIGHLLGLGHSPVQDSTMFADAPAGETKKRDLAEDDRNGVCAVYPKNPNKVVWSVVDSNDGLTPCSSPTSDTSQTKPPAQGCHVTNNFPSLWYVWFVLICFFIYRKLFIVPSSGFRAPGEKSGL